MGLRCWLACWPRVPALAGEMTAEEARRFVIGKMFTYTCFEGTRGQGRVHADGSVVGSIQFQGAGRCAMPRCRPARCRSRANRFAPRCADCRFEPCFNLERINDNSFRGSISGLGFAYCEFTRSPAAARIMTCARDAAQHASAGAAALADRRQQLTSALRRKNHAGRGGVGVKLAARHPSGRLPRSPPCGRDA